MIDRTQKNSVAILRIQHGKANACDLELIRDLDAAISEEISAESTAVVLTGTGNIFSAGVDLFRVVKGKAEYLREFLPAFNAVLHRLYTLPKPVVAAVNGHAIAGGCVFACACDRRLMAADSGRIGVPELLVGVPFPLLALECVRTAIPPHRLHEIIDQGVCYESEEALASGLVEELVPAGDLMDRATQLAAELGAIPAPTFQITKEQLQKPVLDRVSANPDLEQRVLDAWYSEEILNAVQSYVDQMFGDKKPG